MGQKWKVIGREELRKYLCTTKEVNKKALKKNYNLSFRYEIARGSKTLKNARHRR